MKQVFATVLLAALSCQVFAQGLTKNGKISSNGTEYVNKNGAVGDPPGVGRHGQPAAALPVVKTLAVDGIGKGKASLHAEITDDGGAPVTIRGFCWGIWPNPTIGGAPPSMGWSQNGTGTGSFTNSLSGLYIGTKYYVRAFAGNSAGIVYGSEVSFTALAPGDAFQGGIAAYIFQPDDPGYVAGEVHGLIAAAADLPDAVWGCSGTTVGTGQAIGEGLENTDRILNSCSTAGIAAQLCREYSVTAGGVTYNDWYMPSIGELKKLYLNRDAIGGFSNKQYISSTENRLGLPPNEYIQGLSFELGDQAIILHKTHVRPVRPVRTF